MCVILYNIVYYIVLMFHYLSFSGEIRCIQNNFKITHEQSTFHCHIQLHAIKFDINIQFPPDFQIIFSPLTSNAELASLSMMIKSGRRVKGRRSCGQRNPSPVIHTRRVRTLSPNRMTPLLPPPQSSSTHHKCMLAFLSKAIQNLDVSKKLDKAPSGLETHHPTDIKTQNLTNASRLSSLLSTIQHPSLISYRLPLLFPSVFKNTFLSHL